MEGTVKFFNKLKGFGFIKGDDERDYFVHFSEVAKGKYLEEGDRVSFEGTEDEKGLKAKGVDVVGKGGAPAKEETAEDEEPVEEETPAEDEDEEPVEEETPAEDEEEKPKEE